MFNKTWDSVLACVGDRTFEPLNMDRTAEGPAFWQLFLFDRNKQNSSWCVSVSLFSTRWTFLGILKNWIRIDLNKRRGHDFWKWNGNIFYYWRLRSPWSYLFMSYLFTPYSSLVYRDLCRGSPHNLWGESVEHTTTIRTVLLKYILKKCCAVLESFENKIPNLYGNECISVLWVSERV